MTITYEDITTIEKCYLAAAALEQGEASFLVTDGSYCASLHRDLAGTGYEFRLFMILEPDVTLGHGYGPDFPTVLKRAEMLMDAMLMMEDPDLRRVS